MCPSKDQKDQGVRHHGRPVGQEKAERAGIGHEIAENISPKGVSVYEHIRTCK